MEERLTGYGDRVIAQADTAARPPAGVLPARPAATGPRPPEHIARVTIYDPNPYLGEELALKITARLQRDLNAIRGAAAPRGIGEDLSIRFEVRHVARWSTASERSIGALDFPVYILNGHTPDLYTSKNLRELILSHGITREGRLGKLIEEALEGWKDIGTLGVGLVPDPRFRKAAFIKGDLIRAKAKGRNDEAGFSNIIKHEIGHIFRLKHSDQGLMKREINVEYTKHLDYTKDEADIITKALEGFAQFAGSGK